AADMNRDGVTDVGVYVPRSDDSSETLVSDWYFLVSQGTPTAGSVSTLNHAFNQTPFSNDRFFTFGDSFYQPIVGNFDPPVAGWPIRRRWSSTPGSWWPKAVRSPSAATRCG